MSVTSPLRPVISNVPDSTGSDPRLISTSASVNIPVAPVAPVPVAPVAPVAPTGP